MTTGSTCAVVSGRKSLLLLFVLATCQRGLSDLTVTPMDSETLAKASTYFNCSSSIKSKEIQWFHHPVGVEAYQRKAIYAFEKFYKDYEDDFVLEKNSSVATYNLVITSVKPSYAGKYECQENGQFESASAQLIVLDDEPECSCSTQSEEHHLSCGISYHGNIPPELRWIKLGGNDTLSKHVTRNQSDNRITLNLTVNSNDTSSYECQTTKSRTSKHSCTSDNSRLSCSSSSYSARAVVGVVMIVLMAIVVIIVIVIIVLRIRRRRIYKNAYVNVERVVSNPPDREECVPLQNIADGILKQGQEHCETDQAQAVLHKPLQQPVQDIYGLAVLGDEVFISRLRSPEIEVYDSMTFCYKRRIEVNGMTNPEHIVSCSVNNCLYAFDWNFLKGDSAILKIDPTGGNLINSWDTSEGGGRISVANDTNVILNINNKSMLQEYTADGKLLRMIDLDPVNTNIYNAWHALKLSNSQFVVCHGDFDDPPSRVCLISIKGDASSQMEIEVVRTFGAEPGDGITFTRPFYLSIDKMGAILVSDKKAVLLSSNLDKPQVLVTEERLWPWRTCFDESTGQWVMADYNRIMVCRVKDKEVERKFHRLTTH